MARRFVLSPFPLFSVRARSHRRLDRDRTEASYYRQALQIAAAYADAHHALGVVYQKRKQSALAEAMYRRAIDLGQIGPAPHTNLAGLLVSQGKLAEGVAQYEKALELDPEYLAALKGIAQALARLGRQQDAERYRQKAQAVESRKR